MSYMTQLEIHAREAVAMSLLNGLRRFATNKTELLWDESERSIFIEALDFSGSNKDAEKMFFYSFRGMGDNNEAAALQLSEALRAALDKVTASKDITSEVYINAMRTLLEKPDNVGELEKQLVAEVTSFAMDVISNSDLVSARKKVKHGTGI